jgi:hypothetical protein
MVVPFPSLCLTNLGAVEETGGALVVLPREKAGHVFAAVVDEVGGESAYGVWLIGIGWVIIIGKAS